MKRYKGFIFAVVFLFASCAKQPTQNIYDTGFYSDTQMRILVMREFKTAPILADESYQFFNQKALQAFYERYRKDLSDKGVVKWDNKFDCNRFTSYFAALAQIDYFTNGFHAFNKGEGLGVGELYYVDDNLGPHAINVLLVNGEFQYFEPQTGQIKVLSPKEKNSIKMIKF